MNARSISRIAVESSLMLVRLPLDAVIGRLPGNGTGTRPTARLRRKPRRPMPGSRSVRIRLPASARRRNCARRAAAT